MSVHALDIVGGAETIGFPINDSNDLIQAVRSGFSVKTVFYLLGTGRLTAAELDHAVIARKTLVNRKKIGTLTSDQSDKLMRTARVIAAAEDTFGSKEKAAAWLRRATTALNGQAPISLLDTNEGAAQVEALLVRIDHGIAA